MSATLKQVCQALIEGKLVVYPTESVFGLGCQALNNEALIKLRKVKQRSKHKGFIVLCASLDQLTQNFPQLNIEQDQIKRMQQQQGHPTTWLVSCDETLNPLLVGNNSKLAVRITHHPIAKALCESVGPIISSSANVEGEQTVKNLELIRARFLNDVDVYLDEELGNSQSPSQIIDLDNGEIIRSA